MIMTIINNSNNNDNIFNSHGQRTIKRCPI